MQMALISLAAVKLHIKNVQECTFEYLYIYIFVVDDELEIDIVYLCISSYLCSAMPDFQFHASVCDVESYLHILCVSYLLSWHIRVCKCVCKCIYVFVL